MLDWAESRRAPEPEATDPLFVSEFESDAEFIDFLAGLGFQRGAAPLMRLHRRRTDLPVPPATLPEGFTLRHVGDEAEWADRVESHREVWHPSKFTLDGYRQLRSSPGYDPELDLVAVAPDGTIAANTIVWHDEVNRTGQFEPVGTREAFRGLGLAKQLMYEGIRRLAAREAEWAFVNTFEDLEPACQLYLAAGFEIVDKWAAFARTESP
jgi:GNAT superfamily N-acetyltransferase